MDYRVKKSKRDKNSYNYVKKWKNGKVIDEDGFEYDDFDIEYRKQSSNNDKNYTTLPKSIKKLIFK